MPKKRSDNTKPQRRDPAATRKKLLTAARREFADSGLAGARVDEIAARAGVNKQLVYHYFGDKDALYLAVLEWVYEEIRAQERKLNLEGLPPEQAIKKLIESSFDHLAAHPDFIVLLNDENRGGARACARLPQAGGDAFPAGQSGFDHPRPGRQSRHIPQGYQPGTPLYFDCRPQLFLLFEHADPVGDLRQGPVEPGRPAGPPQARGRSGDAFAAALINQMVD